MATLPPNRIERRLEQRFPAYRYGVVLLLLAATFVLMASGPTGAWSRLLTVALQGATLLAVLLASRVGWRLFRIALAVILVSLASAFGALLLSGSEREVAFFALNLLLVLAAPVVIGRALWHRAVVDLHTVLGAICIYVLIGMVFVFVYTIAGEIGSTPFFVQTDHATVPDYLYFSFVTLTTVGYGDFTAAQGFGRALAALEALNGQIYLVTIVSVLVSRLVPRQRPEPEDETP